VVVDAAGVSGVAAGDVSSVVAGGVAAGVAFLRKLLPAGCGVLACAILGNLSADFFATEAGLLADAVTSSTEVSSVF
jgi:hypothetical protein